VPHIDGVNVPEQFVRHRVNATTLGASKTITGATNANPIVITSVAHGFANGDVIIVGSVGGNTAANGWRKVANKTADTFELNYLDGTSVAGNGAYTAGGSAQSVVSATTAVVSTRDIWVTKVRLANTTGAAITFNLYDNLDGGSTPSGPNLRYAAVSIAANSVSLESLKSPERLEQGAVIFASATGLQVTIEGWRKPNFT